MHVHICQLLAFAFHIPTLKTKLFCQCFTKRKKDGDVENNNIENVVLCKHLNLNGVWIDFILYLFLSSNFTSIQTCLSQKSKALSTQSYSLKNVHLLCMNSCLICM